MEFARAFPALMENGVPLSWRHFVYGMAHLDRAHARESLRLAGAVGSLFGKDGERWFKSAEAQAGWR
jgi:hypothetical protein